MQREGVRSINYNVVEQFLPDLLREYMIGQSLNMQISTNFNSDHAADKVSERYSQPIILLHHLLCSSRAELASISMRNTKPPRGRHG